MILSLIFSAVLAQTASAQQGKCGLAQNKITGVITGVQSFAQKRQALEFPTRTHRGCASPCESYRKVCTSAGESVFKEGEALQAKITADTSGWTQECLTAVTQAQTDLAQELALIKTARNHCSNCDFSKNPAGDPAGWPICGQR